MKRIYSLLNRQSQIVLYLQDLPTFRIDQIERDLSAVNRPLDRSNSQSQVLRKQKNIIPSLQCFDLNQSRGIRIGNPFHIECIGDDQSLESELFTKQIC